MPQIATKRDPRKWAAAKRDALARMGGKHSARAMQLAAKLYKERGGGYVGDKPSPSQNSLRTWTKQRWDWSEGDTPGQGGRGVYLPSRSIAALRGTSSGRQALARARHVKEQATSRGQQYSQHGLHVGKNRNTKTAALQEEFTEMPRSIFHTELEKTATARNREMLETLATFLRNGTRGTDVERTIDDVKRRGLLTEEALKKLTQHFGTAPAQELSDIGKAALDSDNWRALLSSKGQKAVMSSAQRMALIKEKAENARRSYEAPDTLVPFSAPYPVYLRARTRADRRVKEGMAALEAELDSIRRAHKSEANKARYEEMRAQRTTPTESAPGPTLLGTQAGAVAPPSLVTPPAVSTPAADVSSAAPAASPTTGRREPAVAGVPFYKQHARPLIGAGIGGAGGAGAGYATADDSEEGRQRRGRRAVAGGLIGAGIGAGAGHLLR